MPVFEPAGQKTDSADQPSLVENQSAEESPVASTPVEAPLSPIQQLLQQAQKLAEQEANQASIYGTSDELFTLLDSRIDSIEGKVNVMLTFFEQATTALRGMATVGGPTSKPEAEDTAPVEPTTRMLLVRLVNSYAAAERRSEHETWKLPPRSIRHAYRLQCVCSG